MFMTSRLKSLALTFFLVCLAVMQIVSVSPVMADSPPVLNANTDPKILREYVKKSDEIIKAKGGKAEYYATKAQLLEWLKDYRGAVAEYSKALNLAPKNVDYLVGRARSYRRIRFFRKAKTDYDRAISLGDRTSEAYLGRALARLELKDFAGAKGDADCAIAANKEEELAWFAKGSAECELGDLQYSLICLSEAIRLSPRQAVFLFRRSQVYRLLGDKERANQDLSLSKRYSQEL